MSFIPAFATQYHIRYTNQIVINLFLVVLAINTEMCSTSPIACVASWVMFCLFHFITHNLLDFCVFPCNFLTYVSICIKKVCFDRLTKEGSHNTKLLLSVVQNFALYWALFYHEINEHVHEHFFVPEQLFTYIWSHVAAPI